MLKGYLYNAEEDDADDLYRRAYNLGILKSNDRDDDRVLSRGDVVKMLLDCAGYGEVAQLSGVFSCAYPVSIVFLRIVQVTVCAGQ